VELVLAQVSEDGLESPRVRNRFPDCVRDDYLAAMGGEADASRGVDGNADVPGVGQRRPAGVQSDPHEHRQVVRPSAGPHPPLDGHRGVNGGARMLEDGKHLVRARIHLAPARCSNGVAKDASDVGQQRPVAIAEACDQPSRVGDVGQ